MNVVCPKCGEFQYIDYGIKLEYRECACVRQEVEK